MGHVVTGSDGAGLHGHWATWSLGQTALGYTVLGYKVLGQVVTGSHDTGLHGHWATWLWATWT